MEELQYLEYSITGDTALYARQIKGDEFPVYVDDFNYNLSQDVIINFVKLTGSSRINDYYYYDVS